MWHRTSIYRNPGNRMSPHVPTSQTSPKCGSESLIGAMEAGKKKKQGLSA